MKKVEEAEMRFLKKSEGNLKRAASVKQLISIEQTGQRMADSHWNSWTERDGGSRNGLMMMMMMMMTDTRIYVIHMS
jgi:hypothetical protein